MKWNELKRIAEQHGWYLWRNGSNHDIYRHPGRRDVIIMERHGNEEIKTGLFNKLRKQTGFDMTTTAIIEKGKDGTYSVYTKDLNSTIVGEGITASQARSDFEQSYKEICQAYEESSEELPDELKDLQFDYKYDVASLFSYFNFINVSQFARYAGINPSLLRQYRSGHTYISAQQLSRIESALHKCGRELQEVSL